MNKYNTEFDNMRMELHNLLILCCNDELKFNAAKLLMEGILSRTHKIIDEKVDKEDEDD